MATTVIVNTVVSAQRDRVVVEACHVGIGLPQNLDHASAREEYHDHGKNIQYEKYEEIEYVLKNDVPGRITAE